MLMNLCPLFFARRPVPSAVLRFGLAHFLSLSLRVSFPSLPRPSQGAVPAHYGRRHPQTLRTHGQRSFLYEVIVNLTLNLTKKITLRTSIGLRLTSRTTMLKTLKDFKSTTILPMTTMRGNGPGRVGSRPRIAP